MKKYLLFLICGLVSIVSCNKEVKEAANRELTDDPSKEIVLSVEDDLPLTFETKATAVTSMPSSLYWGAATASAAKYSSTSGAVSAGKISTGKYQTATATSYTWYASNISMTVGTNTTVSASNTTDVICGKSSATTSTTPSITLGHIFARTGSVTLSLPSGYSQSNVSWQIKSKTGGGTSGTYSITNASWSSQSGFTDFSSLTGSSDYYLVPGTYTVKVTFTASKGDFVKTYTQSGDITLVAGKINNITASSSTDEAQGITISVSLTDWAANPINVNIS